MGKFIRMALFHLVHFNLVSHNSSSGNSFYINFKQDLQNMGSCIFRHIYHLLPWLLHPNKKYQDICSCTFLYQYARMFLLCKMLHSNDQHEEGLQIMCLQSIFKHNYLLISHRKLQLVQMNMSGHRFGWLEHLQIGLQLQNYNLSHILYWMDHRHFQTLKDQLDKFQHKFYFANEHILQNMQFDISQQNFRLILWHQNNLHLNMVTCNAHVYTIRICISIVSIWTIGGVI